MLISLQNSVFFFLFLAASHRAPSSHLAREGVLYFRRLRAVMHRSEITSMTPPYLRASAWVHLQAIAYDVQRKNGLSGCPVSETWVAKSSTRFGYLMGTISPFTVYISLNVYPGLLTSALLCFRQCTALFSVSHRCIHASTTQSTLSSLYYQDPCLFFLTD